jgi:hypothetical protein
MQKMNVRSLYTSAALLGLLFAVIGRPVAAQDGGAGKMDDAKMGHMQMMSRYAGPVYDGKPALPVTAALVTAGGGPENFSIAAALTSMVGKDAVSAEVANLTKQYGEDKVKSWMTVFDFAVKDALKIATDKGVALPKPAPLMGKRLATTLVSAGLDKDQTFYVEYMLDKAVSHGIHVQVMDDIDAKFGQEADADYHRITNQAMYDLAQALGEKKVKLAEYH